MEQNQLHPSIALRICAIREAFEESSVLLARNRDSFLGSTSLERSLFSDVHDNQKRLSKYRHLVNENDEEFLKMCKVCLTIIL